MPAVLNSDTAFDVMITCPTTGKAIHTGMCMEFDAWCALELPPQKCGCPECGKRHEWTKADACLHKDRPQRLGSSSP
jgi:hypothetical protein